MLPSYSIPICLCRSHAKIPKTLLFCASMQGHRMRWVVEFTLPGCMQCSCRYVRNSYNKHTYSMHISMSAVLEPSLWTLSVCFLCVCVCVCVRACVCVWCLVCRTLPSRLSTVSGSAPGREASGASSATTSSSSGSDSRGTDIADNTLLVTILTQWLVVHVLNSTLNMMNKCTFK